MAALFSAIRPITSLERAVAAWPPAADAGLWLNRILLQPWLRWDGVWYAGILTAGYAAGNGSTSFHPLYILLSLPLYRLGADPLLSLLITSALASLLFFWIFDMLAALDLDQEGRRLALVLLGTYPLAIILLAPYPSSVFMLFATLALYEMRVRRWLPAALAAFLAALTRQQGVLLALPMLWCAWEDAGKSIRGLGNAWRGGLASLSGPAGLLAWTIYRIGFLHEGALQIGSWQDFIYSGLVSNSAKAIIPYQSVMWPWQALALTLPGLFRGPDVEDVMTMVLALGFLAMLALAWKGMRPAERIYSLAITLVGFSVYTGTDRLYLSLPRHLFLATPVFVGLAAVLKKRWQQTSLVLVQAGLQVFMLFLFVTKSWIP